MHNIMFNNIIVDNSKGDKNAAFFLTGIPGHDIEQVVIKDVQFIVAGGGTKEDANKTQVNEYTLDVMNGHWPEFYGVGTLPAYGIYARHMDGLVLENISIQTMQRDERVPLILDDVKNHQVRDVTANGKPLTDKDIIIQ